MASKPGDQHVKVKTDKATARQVNELLNSLSLARSGPQVSLLTPSAGGSS